MQGFSGCLISYQMISDISPAETKVCVAVVFYVHVLGASSLLHIFMLCYYVFTSAVDEHNAVRHTHSVKYVTHMRK